jgi:hypothetical protein
VIVQLVNVQDYLLTRIMLALVEVLSASSFVNELIYHIVLALREVPNKFDGVILEILTFNDLYLVVSLYLELFGQF